MFSGLGFATFRIISTACILWPKKLSVKRRTAGHLRDRSTALRLVRALYMTQVKQVYNSLMTVFRYGREHYEEGEYVRRKDAMPGDGLDPVVRIVEDLGTIEIPCGKVACRANCLEYLVRSARKREDYSLAECKISPLVSIL
jgi:hypothetical protein